MRQAPTIRSHTEYLRRNDRLFVGKNNVRVLLAGCGFECVRCTQAQRAPTQANGWPCDRWWCVCSGDLLCTSAPYCKQINTHDIYHRTRTLQPPRTISMVFLGNYFNFQRFFSENNLSQNSHSTDWPIFQSEFAGQLSYANHFNFFNKFPLRNFFVLLLVHCFVPEHFRETATNDVSIRRTAFRTQSIRIWLAGWLAWLGR